MTISSPTAPSASLQSPATTETHVEGSTTITLNRAGLDSSLTRTTQRGALIVSDRWAYRQLEDRAQAQAYALVQERLEGVPLDGGARQVIQAHALEAPTPEAVELAVAALATKSYFRADEALEPASADAITAVLRAASDQLARNEK